MTSKAPKVKIAEAEAKALARNQQRAGTSAFKPEYTEQVGQLCKLGATDRDLALFFNVSYLTVNNWKKQHPEFFVSMLKGRQESDQEVADSLFKSATGYEYFEEQTHKLRNVVGYENGKPIIEERIEVVQVKRYKHPEPVSIFFWLQNRRPDMWRDRKSVKIEVEELDHMKEKLRGEEAREKLVDRGLVEIEGEFEIVGEKK